MSESALNKIVAALPQRDQISDSVVARWVERTGNIDPGRIEWHARRCRGFGGSDIGTLVRGLRGMPMDGFSTDREIVQSKLMLRSPDPQNGHTRRGTILEPLIRDLFLARYQAKARNDIVDAMQSYVSTKHPWLVGNPDEIAEMPDGSIWVIDYKSPTPKTMDEYRSAGGISFDYSAQVHQMELIAREAANVEIAGRLLCSFDIMEGDIDVRFVEYDPDLVADILRAGDYYWNEFVMKGLVPAMAPDKEPLELTDSRMQSSIEAMSEELINAHALATVSYAHAAKLKDQLASTISGYGDLPAGKHTLACNVIVSNRETDTEEIERLLSQHDRTLESFVTSITTDALDDTRVIEYLRNSGMSDDEIHSRFCIVTESPNPKAAIAFLAEAGEDVSRCEKTKVSVEITKSRKGAVADVLSSKKDFAKGVLSRYLLGRAVQQDEHAIEGQAQVVATQQIKTSSPQKLAGEASSAKSPVEAQPVVQVSPPPRAALRRILPMR